MTTVVKKQSIQNYLTSQQKCPKNLQQTSTTDKQNSNQFQKKYFELFKQFNAYKQSSTLQLESLLQQSQKHKNHNQNLVRKLQKKYDNLLNEERIKSTKLVDKLQKNFQRQRQTFREIIANKNLSIEKLSEMIMASEKQKTQIVDENTQNLINMVKSQENCLQMKKYSYTQLMKMYQYLLQENNCIKKQLIKMSQLSSNSPHKNHQQLKNVEKTKRTKRNKDQNKLSSPFYTQGSQKSKYIPQPTSKNQASYNETQKIAIQKPTKSKQKSKSREPSEQESFLINSSGIISQYHIANNNNKTNSRHQNSSSKQTHNNSINQKTNKVNSSYLINQQPSKIIEEKYEKEVKPKKKTVISKPPIYTNSSGTAQNTKKLK